MQCFNLYLSFFFFFNDTATTEIYTLSLHDALPIIQPARCGLKWPPAAVQACSVVIEPFSPKIESPISQLRCSGCGGTHMLRCTCHSAIERGTRAFNSSSVAP